MSIRSLLTSNCFLTLKWTSQGSPTSVDFTVVAYSWGGTVAITVTITITITTMAITMISYHRQLITRTSLTCMSAWMMEQPTVCIRGEPEVMHCCTWPGGDQVIR